MLVYILLALMGIQVLKMLKHTPLSYESFINYVIPYWEQGDGQDKLLGVLQLFVIACISLVKASKTIEIEAQVVVFSLTFLSYIWLVRLLASLLEWLQEYLAIMTTNIIFTVLVPLTILMNMDHIKQPVEVKVCFIALLMSVMIVYTELIGLVLGVGGYKTLAQKIKKNKGLKLKSIVTWFFIILGNLYTVVVFIQFYMGPRVHHFIRAEELTKESAVDLLYYLIVTFTTVGFGDISPNTLIAKLVTALIALSGMLFTGLFVGCMLTLEE